LQSKKNGSAAWSGPRDGEIRAWAAHKVFDALGDSGDRPKLRTKGLKRGAQARGNFHARPWPQFPQPVMKIAIPAYRPIGPLAGYRPATPFRLRVPSHPMAGTAWGLTHLPLNKFERILGAGWW